MNAINGDQFILYLGQDNQFFEEIMIKLEKEFSHTNLSLIRDIIPSEGSLLKLAQKILDHNWSLIVLDFSYRTKQMLGLAEIFSFQKDTSESAIHCWTPPSCDPLLAIQIQTLNVDYVHTKGIDTFDIVYSCHLALAKKLGLKVELPNYLKVEVEELLWTQSLMRIGYCTQEYIHVETDLEGEVEERFWLASPLCQYFDSEADKTEEEDDETGEELLPELQVPDAIAQRLPPIARVELKRVIDENHYYPTKHVWDLGPAFSTQKEIVQGETHPKRIRVLIVDPELSFLGETEKELDRYFFSLRIFPQLDAQGEVLRKIKAGIIVVAFPELEQSLEEEKDAQKILLDRQVAHFQMIVKKIKEMDSYWPLVLAMNLPSEYHGKIDLLDYPKLMVEAAPLTLPVLKKFAQVYRKKGGRKQTHDPQKSFADREVRRYMHKSHPDSIGYVLKDVKLKLVSESYLILEYRKHPPGRRFKLLGSLPLWFTVLREVDLRLATPLPPRHLVAMLNSPGAKGKAKLRQWLNELIKKDEG